MALLDSGADRSYISRDLVNKLRPRYIGRTDLHYAPFASRKSSPLECAMYDVSFIDCHDCMPNDCCMSFCEVPTICAPLRRVGISPAELSKLGPVPLSDAFEKDRSITIDLLIGLDHYWDVMTGRSLRLSPSLMAQESRFGWVVSGAHSSLIKARQVSTMMLCPESLVRSMWELETIGISHAEEPQAHDEVMREFISKVSHDGERYQVALPWNDKKGLLCANRSAAEARLPSLRKKLSRDPALERDYATVLSEYESLGFVEHVPAAAAAAQPGPVHASSPSGERVFGHYESAPCI